MAVVEQFVPRLYNGYHNHFDNIGEYSKSEASTVELRQF